MRVRLIALPLAAMMFFGAAASQAETLAETADRLALEAAAQAAAPTTKREPVVAFALSLLIPGLGQLYNGPTERTKGIVMMGVAVGTIGMMIAGSDGDCDDDEDFEFDCDENEALVAVGALGYLGNYIYSLVDAPLRAGAINRQNGLAFNIQPEYRAGRAGGAGKAGGDLGVRASASWRVAF